MIDMIKGTAYWDTILLGSGAQTVMGGDSRDVIISYGDAGEPDPAQTMGAMGRVNDPIAPGSANDVLTGGKGADRFEFHALIDAKVDVVGEHTGIDGRVNWGNVAGDNDNVHDHWVNGFGLDTITDYSRSEGDKIVIKGHTATISNVSYGSDAGGSYSLITVISQQGNGGAGGANTATGAHDEDPLGQIKVYGDMVRKNDVKVVNTNDGIDRLYHADELAKSNGGSTQEVFSNSDGSNYDGALQKQVDVVHIGEGRQSVDAGGGDDRIFSYSDGGEPDPAQTNGAMGRVNDPVADGAADDVIKGGQGRDTFAFRLLLNAKEEILDKHTRADGSMNWRKVAGENDNVHDHWVEGIGNDTILDFSKQDKDRIDIRGHTVEIASITYGMDEGGDYSLISLRSQQGAGGGAHDEDPLGSIKVYGDKVTKSDIILRARVFDGVDQLDDIANKEKTSPAQTVERLVEQPVWTDVDGATTQQSFVGTEKGDRMHAGTGSQTLDGGAGHDRLISYGDMGEPDPSQTDGAEGRVNDPMTQGAGNDVLTGGAGTDKFEFHALLNARAEVIAQHTDATGNVDWRGVAGENDNVHDHWVEGFGHDVITDFTKKEWDSILVRGHTAQVAEITYGMDEGGSYSLIRVISQQGNGGAGGANTATGAHDEDPLGTIKVYGDEVTMRDVRVQANGVFDGVDRLGEVDALGDYNGGVQVFMSSEDGDTIVTAPEDMSTADTVKIGYGSQTVSAGSGQDKIYFLGDAGEPDPAQTMGADGRYAEAIDPELADDVVSGGQGKDVFTVNALLNATDVVLAKHTKDGGSINWRGVAGENDAVHDHWVEGIGNDVLLDYSRQDGDKIVLRGHTMEVAGITYGEDEGGDYSLISMRSQQGAGGGAHDEDPLGTLKVYGDKVTRNDLKVQARVFDGIDEIAPLNDQPAAQFGSNAADTLSGTEGGDNLHGEGGMDVLIGGGGNDFLFGGAGHDHMQGGSGDDWLEGSWGLNTLDGGAGDDRLASSAGRNQLTGGAGEDAFIFYDRVSKSSILDWEDGVDKIDLSRAEKVDDFGDLMIRQMSDTSAMMQFTNDAGRKVSVEVLSDTAFTLGANDFLF